MPAPTHTWDPERYLAFADERSRPFVDLLARVGAEAPRTVVDLGCGPGHLTALLARRWPEAHVAGLDSSPAMVARAVAEGTGGVAFHVADLRDWSAPDGVDVLVSNATLQWLPDHLALLPHLVTQVRPGGWFAFQVPGNFEEPSHTLRRDLADQDPYAAHTRDVATPASHDPTDYWTVLTALGCDVDVWETTYLHQLRGEDPVFTWVSGTGARPTLEALPDDLRPRFEEELKRRLAAAYPPRRPSADAEPVVLLPFRRIFVVARVPAGTPSPAAGGAR